MAAMTDHLSVGSWVEHLAERKAERLVGMKVEMMVVWMAQQWVVPLAAYWVARRVDKKVGWWVDQLADE